jgi:uncharacterized membrane protein YdjX (TVP38/TMEM64 family)
MKKRKIVSALSLGLVGFSGILVIYFQRHLLVNFLQWISSIGIWGNILFILVFLIVGFPFALGYVPLSVVAGYLYGMVKGTITISIGAMCGASVAFWLCRTVTQNWMKRKLATNPKWHVFMLEVERNAWKITLLSRLLPFPFGLVNGLFALSSISFHVFLIGSFLGLLPFQLMWTYFGTTLRSITEAVNGEMPFGVWQQFLLLIQIALGIGLSLYLLHLGRTTMDSTNASISGESVEVDAFGFDISEHEIVELEHDDFCETSDVGVGLHYREKWI